MGTLFVSDLDGTLLRNDATLSEFSKDQLNELLRSGMVFTVASARSVIAMACMLKGLNLTLPVVEFNGAFISDLRTGWHRIVNSIDSVLAEDIYCLVKRFGCVPFVSTFNGKEDRVYYCDIINGGMRWYLEDRLANQDKRWRKTDSLANSLRDQVVCFTVIGEPGVLSELESAVQERHGGKVVTSVFENQYSRGWYWLTVFDWRATKDRAIRLLMDTHGLSEHRLVVFGDHNNDIRMFQTADWAVAVANATPELKRYASEIIGSNEDDSVVKYLLDRDRDVQADL
ncbi:MAG: HAD hydrolase family protein [Limnochordia bacterium]|jgi:Cof subfamily protein (haloacid dehalogenase superfamily)